MSRLSFKGCCVTFEASPFVFSTLGVSTLPTVAAPQPSDPLYGTDWPSQASLLEDYLEPEAWEWNERTSSIEGDLKVSGLDFTIHDRRITAGILAAKRPITWLATRVPTAIGYTALATSIGKDDVSIDVTNGTKLGSFPRVIYIGEEAIYCDSIFGNIVTVNVDGRGYYGTAARAHTVDTANGSAPLVYKDIPTFHGRKVVFWYVDGANVATPLWRGIVQNRHSTGKETSYRFSCEHLWTRERARRLGIPNVSTRLRGVDPRGIGWTIDNPLTFHADSQFRHVSSLATTIAAGSNGVNLPGTAGVIHVASTTGYPVAGVIVVKTVTIPAGETVRYTGISPTTFTGCTGGTATMTTGDVVLGDGSVGAPNTLEEACQLVTADMRSLLRGASYFNSDNFRSQVTTADQGVEFLLSCPRGGGASPVIGLSLRGVRGPHVSATSGNPADPRIAVARVNEAPRALQEFLPGATENHGVSSLEGLPTTWTDSSAFDAGTHTTARYLLRGTVSDGVNLNCAPESYGAGPTGPFIRGQWTLDGDNVPAGPARLTWIAQPVEMLVQLLVESDHWAYALRRGIIENTGAIQSGIDAASWAWDQLNELVRQTSGGPVSRSLILDGTSTLDSILSDACKLTGAGVGIRSGGRMALFPFRVPLTSDVVSLSIAMDDHQVEPTGETLPEGVVNTFAVNATQVRIVVNDRVSIETYGPNRVVEVSLDGMGALASSTAPAQQLATYIASRPLGLWKDPVGTALVTTTIANLIDGPFIGDLLEVTEYSIPDGQGERGLTAARGQIAMRKVRIDATGESESFVAYEALLYPHQGLAGYSPAARVASVAGDTITIDTEYLPESSTITDYAGSNQAEYPGATLNDGGTGYFEVGDIITAYEIDSASPATPETVEVDTVNPLTRTITTVPDFSAGWAAIAAAGRMDIEAADYDDAAESQHAYAYVADFADDTIGTAEDPSRKFAP